MSDDKLSKVPGTLPLVLIVVFATKPFPVTVIVVSFGVNGLELMSLLNH